MRQRVIVILLLLSAQIAWAQSTRVRGKVTDAETGEGLPFVNVFFTGTTIGQTTDFEGNYYLETREKVSELQVSMVGYVTQKVKVAMGVFRTFDFALKPQAVDLEEVKVTPGENPADIVLRKVIRNKPRNNPSYLPEYACRTYTKMELDLTNIKPGFKNKKLQKNFGFVFNHMDTSVVTGKAYLPVMISESSADYYFRKSPAVSREVVRASRISGIEEDYTLAQFTGHMHGKVNFYDNYIDIFDVRFASPLSDHGRLFYKYYLVDSLRIDGRKTYKIRFHPKAFSTPVLDGEVHIDSLTWALQSAHVKMMKGLNVNWVRNLALDNENQLVGDSVWFPKQDRIFADFSVFMSDSSKMVSFLGHRQIDYSAVRLKDAIPREVERMDNEVMIDSRVLNRNEQYWDTVRPYALSEKEKQIYGMVDSIKNVPLYRTIYDVLSMLLGGYYETGPVEWGPYYKLLSFNDQEGIRFQLGARTTTDFSRKWRLSAYGAYSLKDEAWKGGGGVEYVIRELPTSKLNLSYKHDMVQLGSGVNALTESNILSSIFSRDGGNRLTMVHRLDFSFEQEWRQGFTNTLGVQSQRVFANAEVPFIRPSGESLSSIASTVVSLNTRFSKNETVIRKTFDKYSLGADYPIVSVDLAMGVKGLLKNDFEFYRVAATLSYDLHLAPIGTSEIVLTGGKIFGKVPYPLLKLHEGNATYFYDNFAYSCMNYYEFASDAWVSLFYEHHFKGFFLGKIPLLKKLKWREVFVLKALVGTLSDKNNGSVADSKAVLRFPVGLGAVSKPYVEAGIGVENIFRLIRLDAVWRLTHRTSEQDIQNFTLNVSMDLNF